MKPSLLTLPLILVLMMINPAMAADHSQQTISLVNSGMGYFSIILFVLAYSLVIFEEQLHLRKSKPVILVAGIIWVMVAISFNQLGQPHAAEEAIRHNLLEYTELFLFLLAAMTYINSMDERHVFQALRTWLVNRNFSLRVIFWVTGVLSFFISPIADNLTTALLMGAVAMAVGRGNQPFVVIACINIVVAANAGGAFSPFGDITTLMVWQKGKVEFVEFFAIFFPSVVNWLIPALIMSFAVSHDSPAQVEEDFRMKIGAKRIMFLFILTITTAVCFHNFLHLPPATGMMLGLGYLGFFSYYLKKKERRLYDVDDNPLAHQMNHSKPLYFDLFRKVARAEWDTLLFFYGVILCVGGLSQFGYMALLSNYMYHDLGTTNANIAVGVLSAILDNIPVMFAVLTMDPSMSLGQWLLVTLTAGVGGSLLSIGSAAGVALMGSARGIYTFGAHLKWTPIIALGYGASIIAHLYINRAIM